MREKPAKPIGFDLHDYEVPPDTRTGEGIRRELAYFVERVRSGKSVNREYLALVADGVERYLADKKKDPWPAQRGLKKSSRLEALAKAYPRWAEYMLAMRASQFRAARATPSGRRSGKLRPKDAITRAAENCGVDDATIERAIALVERAHSSSEREFILAGYRQLARGGRRTK